MDIFLVFTLKMLEWLPVWMSFYIKHIVSFSVYSSFGKETSPHSTELHNANGQTSILLCIILQREILTTCLHAVFCIVPTCPRKGVVAVYTGVCVKLIIIYHLSWEETSFWGKASIFRGNEWREQQHKGNCVTCLHSFSFSCFCHFHPPTTTPPPP